MQRLLQRAYNMFRRSLQNEQPTGAVATAFEETLGVAPDVSFDVLVDWYLRDNYVKYAVEAYAARIASPFFITGRQPEALELVGRFLKLNRFSSLTWLVARDLVLTGNSFLNVVPSVGISSVYHIPVSSIVRIRRTVTGDVLSYEQMWGGSRRSLPPSEVHHYRYNPVDEKPFGEGLVQHLTRTGVGYKVRNTEMRRPSWLEIKERIDNAVRILIEKYPPRSIFRTPAKHRDQFASTYNSTVIGQDLVVDFDLQQEEVKVDARTRFAELFEYTDRGVLTGLHNPLVRLITYTGFSRASAEAAIETLEPEVGLYQRFMAEENELLLGRVLESWKFDRGAAEIRWNWGSPQRPDFVISDLLRAVEIGVVKPGEAREMLREVAGWVLDERAAPSQVGAASHFMLWRGELRPLSDMTYRFIVGRRDGYA